MSKRTFTLRSTVSQSAITGTDQQLSSGIDFADVNWWAWEGNGNVSFSVQFPTPINSPQIGAGLQSVRLLLRKTAAGGNAVPCSFTLRQNGVDIVALGSQEIVSNTGEIIVFSWNASALANPDGSLIELAVDQTSGGTGNPAARRAVEINSAELTIEDGIGTRRLVRHRACDGSCCIAAPRFPLGAGTPEDPHQGSDCQFHLNPDGKEHHGCQIMENTVLLPNPGIPTDLKLESRDALTMFLETCLDWPQNTPIDDNLGNCCWRWEDDI